VVGQYKMQTSAPQGLISDIQLMRVDFYNLMEFYFHHQGHVKIWGKEV